MTFQSQLFQSQSTSCNVKLLSYRKYHHAQVEYDEIPIVIEEFPLIG